jgi:hypothetical protein
VLDQRLGEVLGGIETETVRNLASALQLLQQLGLALDAEAGKAVQLARLGRLPEVGHRADLQLVVKQPRAFGADAGHVGDLDESRRQLRLCLVQHCKVLRLYKLGDLAGEVGADTGQLGQVLARLQHLGGAAREVLDGTRRPAVGPHPERVGPLDLEQIGEVVEGRRDLRIVDRHRTRPQLWHLLSGVAGHQRVL